MDEMVGLDLQERTALHLQMALVPSRRFLVEIPRAEAFRVVALGALPSVYAHDLYHACPLHLGDLETLGQMAAACRPEVFPSRVEIRGVADLPYRA